MLLHASCVAIDGRAVLITGPSGAGKSDLALRLIDRGAVLVSDDQVALKAVDGQLLAAAPATIAGRMEVRGIGIVAMAHASPMPVALLIDLSAAPERMPEPAFRELCGVAVPVLALAGLEHSGPIKVELALRELPA
jgi:serine kinase of HPr protein (carbohydrate metabolism regulator)